MDTRIAERRAEVRRDRMHRRRRRTVVAAVVAAAIAVVAWVERSPLVALEAVEVVGTDRLDPDIVRAAAQLPLGTSTLRLRLGPARERVEDLPLVASATVRRVDPLTVRIDVVERLPALLVTTAGGPVLAADDGVVLGPPTDRDDPADLLALDLGNAPPLHPGDRLQDRPAAAAALEVHAGLTGPLRALVAGYAATAAGDVTVTLEQGVVVRFGRADRVAEKARVLGALLEQAQLEPGAAVDVRAPNNPVVVPPAA